MKLTNIKQINKRIRDSNNLLIERDELRQCIKYINKEKSLVLSGLRQIGKTTILHQLLKKYDNSFFLSIPENSNTDIIKSIIDHMVYEEDTKIFLIDEIQNIPDWTSWIIDLYNEYQTCVFVISGSASVKSSNTVGSARFRDVKLLPLSFDEFIKISKLNNIEYDEGSVLNEYLGKNAITSYFGDEINIRDVKDDYLDTYIYRDIIKYEDNPPLKHELMNAFEYLKNNSSGEFELTKAARIIFDNETTNAPRKMKSLLDTLIKYNLMMKLERKNIDDSISNRVAKYYINPHVYLILNETDFNSLPKEKRGYVIESFLYFYYFKDQNTFYIKQSNNAKKYAKHEVDFSVNEKWYEVKASNILKNSYNSLNELFKQHKLETIEREVIYLGDSITYKKIKFKSFLEFIKTN